MVSQPLDVCKSFFQMLLFTLIHFKMICLSQADLVLSELSFFYYTNLKERKTGSEFFQKVSDRLDYSFDVKYFFILFWKRGLVWTTIFLKLLCTKYQIASLKLIIDHMIRPHSFSITFATVIPNHQESVKINEMFSKDTKSS